MKSAIELTKNILMVLQLADQSDSDIQALCVKNLPFEHDTFCFCISSI